MLAAKFIQRSKQGRRRHRFAVQRDAVALFKIDGDIFGRVWRIFGIDGARIDIIGRFIPRVLKHFAFGRGVQQVGVGRKRAFAALVLGHWNLVLFGPFDQPCPARQVPLTPRRNHLDVGVQRISRKFEPHLIIALARCAMRNRIRAGFGGNFDQPLGNERTGNRCAQQIVAFIPRIGAHHRKNEIAHKFFAQIIDVDMVIRHAHQHSLFACWPKLFALPQIGGEGDDFAAIFHLQPFQDDAGVESTRICEDDFFNAVFGHIIFRS